jgi:CRISPR/Cas system-associated endonuclease Cas3-HD
MNKKTREYILSKITVIIHDLSLMSNKVDSIINNKMTYIMIENDLKEIKEIISKNVNTKSLKNIKWEKRR